MNEALGRFIHDYVTDKRAIQKALSDPSPIPISGSNRPDWNRGIKFISKDDDILRHVLGRRLTKLGFDVDYEIASHQFDTLRASALERMEENVAHELLRKEVLALISIINQELQTLEQTELRRRRGLLKLFLNERKEIKTIMLLDWQDRIQSLEFYTRKELFKAGLVQLEMMKIEENNCRKELMNRSKTEIDTLENENETSRETKDSDMLSASSTELISKAVSKSHFLGITLTELGEIDQPLGLTVDSMYIGGPGDEAGMRLGDIIIAVAGVRVPSFEKFKEIIAEQPRGKPISFVLVKSGNFGSNDECHVSEVKVTLLTTDVEFAPLGNQYYFDPASHQKIYRSDI